MAGPSSCTAWAMFFRTVSTTGSTFSATVPTLSISWAESSLMLALSLPKPVTKLLHAAFMALTDPSMVVLASSAVVPVIPISVWTVWMASTMSA